MKKYVYTLLFVVAIVFSCNEEKNTNQPIAKAIKEAIAIKYDNALVNDIFIKIGNRTSVENVKYVEVKSVVVFTTIADGKIMIPTDFCLENNDTKTSYAYISYNPLIAHSKNFIDDDEYIRQLNLKPMTYNKEVIDDFTKGFLHYSY